MENIKGKSFDTMEAVVWHSLAWLLVANGVGLLLATLLLFPELNGWLGEWTYGRWMPVHMNLQLYGWCSLPLVGWLLQVYQVERTPAGQWSRAALWGWSAALAVGAVSWLNGHTSGKLFLDWQGYARVLFPLATFFLWLLLVWSWQNRWRPDQDTPWWLRSAKLAGLVALLLVPATLYWAADPRIYPPVNPDTGGPTGASLLESTLGIIAILLVLPYGCGRKRRPAKTSVSVAWWLFGAEIILSLLLGRDNASHHRPAQFLGLGSLLPWMLLMPAYYDSFLWPRHARRWLHVFLGWWSILLASAWLIFFPGLLDRFKFTDGLVGHSHMAMAGFVSSLNIFLLVVLLGEKQGVFDSKWAFAIWQSGVAGYVAVMFLAGWFESQNPAFTIIPGGSRNLIYSLRLIFGGLMTAAAAWWFFCLTRQKLAAGHSPFIVPSSVKCHNPV